MENSDVNVFCFLIFLNNMVWYLVVTGKIRNDECLTYIFTGGNDNGTPIIFNKTIYHYCYKELKNHSSPILNIITHTMYILKPY